MRPTLAYGPDIAFIHDAGYGYVAHNAAIELLRILKKSPVARSKDRTIVDLGCGSGILCQAITAAGYPALGIDLSEPMLALAIRRAPQAEFRHGSFLSEKLPTCRAVTAIGEVFNYQFDRRNRGRRLPELFCRIYEALIPGGTFLFDVAEPGRARPNSGLRTYSEGEGWACAAAAVENRRQQTLTRTITAFRRIGPLYRRSDEVHRLRLYSRLDVSRQLRDCGFKVRLLRHYGIFRFPPGWIAFVATKPRRIRRSTA